MRGILGWLMAFLLGLALGWGGRTLRGRHEPWGPVVRARIRQVETARAEFARRPSRENRARLIRTLLHQRDALSVEQFPEGDDPRRYELTPELVRLIGELDLESVTREERKEWWLLYHHAYNPPS